MIHDKGLQYTQNESGDWICINFNTGSITIIGKELPFSITPLPPTPIQRKRTKERVDRIKDYEKTRAFILSLEEELGSEVTAKMLKELNAEFSASTKEQGQTQVGDEPQIM